MTRKITEIISGIMSIVMTISLAAKPVYAASGKKTSSGVSPLLIVIPSAFIVLGLAVIIVILLSAKREKKAENAPKPVALPVSSIVPKNYNEIISVQIRKHDPDFSSVKFCDWCKNVYIRTMTSISEQQLQDIRLLAEKDYYRKLQDEQRDMLSLGNVNIFRNIIINRAYLQHLRQYNNQEFLTVYICGEMQCYMADAAARKPLPGYVTDQQPFKTLVTFVRSMKGQTTIVNGLQAMCCQCCGAPSESIDELKCSYCGSELIAGEDQWQLCSLDMMKDDRPLDDRGIVEV